MVSVISIRKARPHPPGFSAFNMTEGHTLNHQILRDIFPGFGSFSL